MAEEGHKQPREDMRLAMALLGRKLVTEAQLKAALDYQRSLGVRLSDALVRLSILKPHEIEEAMAGGGMLETPPPGAREASPAEDVLDPRAVRVADLKVHKKLLAKLPRDLIFEHLLVVFFPPPGVSQRKIVLGCGKDAGPDLVKKVRSIVGVDVVRLRLDADEAASVLAANGYPVPRDAGEPAEKEAEEETGELEGASEGPPPAPPKPVEPESPRAAPPPERPPAPAPPEAPPRAAPASAPPQPARAAASPAPADRSAAPAGPSVPVRGEFLLQALIGLLAKKGVITREELELEVELARIRERAGSAVTVAP